MKKETNQAYHLQGKSILSPAQQKNQDYIFARKKRALFAVDILETSP